MSNQVYANSQQKFYPSAGIDRYTVPSGLTIAAATSSAVLFASPAVFLQSPGYCTVATGAITVNTEGVYSISAQVALNNVASGASLGSQPRSVDVSLKINSGMFAANDAVLCRDKTRLDFVARTNEAHVITVQYTGYLRAGTVLSVVVANLEPSDTVFILQAPTYLDICKLI